MLHASLRDAGRPARLLDDLGKRFMRCDRSAAVAIDRLARCTQRRAPVLQARYALLASRDVLVGDGEVPRSSRSSVEAPKRLVAPLCRPALAEFDT
jgi:hypothetical protein